MPEDVQPEVSPYLSEYGLPRFSGGSQEADPAPAGDPQGSEAQPQGQGDPDGTGGLYDLSSVPEDLRQFVEPHLKSMEANATKRFQEHADYRKNWEAYEELGIQDMDPGMVRQLLDFADLAQDNDRFAEWWNEVGQRMDLFPDAGSEEPDLDAFLDDELTPEQVRDMVAEAVQQAVDPLQERFDSSDQAAAEAENLAAVQAELNALVEEHGEENVDREAVTALAYAYAEEDPENCIQRGFEDYKRIRGAGEAGLFAEKVNQPKPPEGGGGSGDTRPEPVTDFEEAKKQGLARLKAAHSV